MDASEDRLGVAETKPGVNAIEVGLKSNDTLLDDTTDSIDVLNFEEIAEESDNIEIDLGVLVSKDEVELTFRIVELYLLVTEVSTIAEDEYKPTVEGIVLEVMFDKSEIDSEIVNGGVLSTCDDCNKYVPLLVSIVELSTDDIKMVGLMIFVLQGAEIHSLFETSADKLTSVGNGIVVDKPSFVVNTVVEWAVSLKLTCEIDFTEKLERTFVVELALNDTCVVYEGSTASVLGFEAEDAKVDLVTYCVSAELESETDFENVE